MGGTVSLYDVLKSRKAGLSPDLYTKLRAQREMPERVITAEPPIYFKSDGTAISEYQISGDTIQNGTPTPDNPIEVLGVGDRTANLLPLIDETVDVRSVIVSIDSQKISFAGTAVSSGGRTTKLTANFTIPAGTYHVKTYGNSSNAIFYLTKAADDSALAAMGDGTFTLTQDTEVYFGVNWIKDETYSETDVTIMLNEGSTALPYEPYGYKIPITSASTTTPIYIGEVQTTRRIKKLVLTGEEDITSRHLDVNLFNVLLSDYLKKSAVTTLSTHYIAQANVNGWTEVNDKSVTCYKNAGSPTTFIYIRDSSYATVEAFKTYLQQQYAAGTPVKVWYVLATEEAGIVNEPLMKIGDYADTLSKEQAGAQIPTVKGNNELNISTTVTPEIMLKGKIKQLPDSDMNALLSVMEEM